MPIYNLVVAQIVDVHKGGGCLGSNHFAQLLRQIVAASQIGRPLKIRGFCVACLCRKW